MFYRDEIDKFLRKDYKYYDAQITRIYITRKDKRKVERYYKLWKEIWDNKKVLIVEGEKTRFGSGNNLLSNAKLVKRLICPPTNAYEKHDAILSSTREMAQDFDLVILALGPTATILAYELSQNGIWALDAGNLDIEYEWKLMGVEEKREVPGKDSVEVESSGQEVAPPARYLSEIIGYV